MGTLLNELSQLKTIVAEAVSTWKGDEPLARAPQRELQPLVGHWFNTESGSHVYSRLVRGELVSPYCYGGNNDLTGVYYGWRRTGEYWFARYQWIHSNLSGFSFLRMSSLETLNGAWWSSEQELSSGDAPPRSAGVPASWIKQPEVLTPSWAEKFFIRVEREGFASVLDKLS